LVVYEDLPYQISEVDYDDLTIHLYSGEMGDNGFWVGEELEELRNIK
jgi:hypothetical protein